jgi:DNA-binding transcriptional LysR family regulator
MHSNYELSALSSFIAVVEAKSFRGGALALSIPKSTVSHRVAALEQQLGEALFLRSTRSVSLTAAGKALYDLSADPLRRLADGMKRIQKREAYPRGVLRITAPVAVGEHMLRGVIAEYMQRFPEVLLSVDLTDRVVDVVKEGYDLALRAGPLKDSSLKAKPLGAATIGTYASKRYLEVCGAPAKPADLAAHDCIAFGPQQIQWPFMVRKKAVFAKIRVRARVNSFIVARELVAAGLGVARLPQAFSSVLVGRGEIVPILEAYALPPNKFYAVMPSLAQPSVRVQAFLNLLSAQRVLVPIP